MPELLWAVEVGDEALYRCLEQVSSEVRIARYGAASIIMQVATCTRNVSISTQGINRKKRRVSDLTI